MENGVVGYLVLMFNGGLVFIASGDSGDGSTQLPFHLDYGIPYSFS